MFKLAVNMSVVALFVFGLIGITHASSADYLQPSVNVTLEGHLTVNGSAYFDSITVGRQKVGGVTYFNGTIINQTIDVNGDPLPVTFGDDVRIDGEIWRGYMKGDSDNMPIKISDSMIPTLSGYNKLGYSSKRWSEFYSIQGNFSDTLTVNGLSGVTDADIPDAITASNYLPLVGGTVSGSINVGGDLGVLGHFNATTSDFSQRIVVGSSYADPGTGMTLENGNIDLNGDLVVDGSITDGTATLTGGDWTGIGDMTIGGTVDMTNNLITNIGHADTDFTAGGGLDIKGVVNIDSDTYIMGNLQLDGGDITNVANIETASIDIGGGYGSTGLTVSSSGNLSMDGDLVVDGGLTLARELITTPEVIVDAATNPSNEITTTLLRSTTSTGNYAVALSAGVNGQIKIITMTAHVGTDDYVLTPNSRVGFADITFDAAGESVILQYVDDGTSFGWTVLSVQGATVS